jgi:hypothetical protein
MCTTTTATESCDVLGSSRSTESDNAASVLSHWKKQLITREDFGHVHKTLGVLCGTSYAWRIAKWGTSDMGFATHRAWTVPTIVLHTTLTLSAFGFAIPLKRIKSGDRIWPENRLHSLVFLSRSLALVALYEY